jgi:hypothetical protein
VPTIQQQIVEKFLTKLSESEKADPGKIEKLRAALAATKKPRADDFVKIFTESEGGDLK